MQRLLSQIGRSQRLAVVNHLKRSADGLPVRELAKRLGMSYMGVKQHCLDLEKDGYLDTFRRHRGVGRPELLYRLTAKAQDLFPQADNALAISLLEQARKLFGPGAADKMLYLHYQQQAADYAGRIRGETLVERAKSLAKLRDKEGYMADVLEDPLRIVERHHPMLGLAGAYPAIAGLERDLFQRVLGVPVTRDAVQTGANYECVFRLG